MSSSTLESPPPATTSPAPVEDDVVLSVQGVSKHYKLWTSPSVRLHYSMLSQAHRTLRTVLPRHAAPLTALRRRRDALHQDFTALQPLSFEVRRGESLGIIGHNGAGKSTLLQIIAGTLRPSTGDVEVAGRIAALLELGSGFNVEYTGRENIYLNASILGLTKDETNAKFDDIVAFADIGQFLEQPVKTYSSGMVLRLAFAVSVHVEPDILIVDEALAVGDIYFQSKCNQLLKQRLDDGLTLLLVSHNPAAVRTLCRRGLVLDHGRCAFLGPSEQAVQVYHELGDRRSSSTPDADAEPLAPAEPAAVEKPVERLPPIGQIEDQIGSRELIIIGCGLFNAPGRPCRDFAVGETIHAGLSFRSLIDADDVMIGFVVRDKYGNAVTALTTVNQGLDLQSVRRGGTYTIHLTIPGRLGQGEYLLDFGVGGQPTLTGSPGYHYHRIGGIAAFTVGWHGHRVQFQGMCDVSAEFRWADR